MLDLIFFYWIGLDFIQLSDDSKINHNMIKLNHALLSSVLSYYISYQYSSFMNLFFYNFSKTYFIWDTIKLINANSLSVPIFFHHLGTIYLLSEFNQNYNPILSRSFCIGELSNISIYLTYYAIKINYKYVHYVELFQIAWYGYFRIYLLSTYVKYLPTLQNKILSVSLFIIYLMGILWWGVLIKKYLNEHLKCSLKTLKFDFIPKNKNITTTTNNDSS